jgi:predicted membrane-bound mannosyltransferase
VIGIFLRSFFLSSLAFLEYVLWNQFYIRHFTNYSQGLYGVFVIKFNLQMASFRRRYLADHGVAEVVTLAALTSMFGYFNRFLRIDMTESLAILFRECDNGGDYDNLCQYVLINQC